MSDKNLLTIKDAWDAFYDFSRLLSEVCRNFCYSGIAVVWILKPSESVALSTVPSCLVLSLLFFSSSLLCDFLQYLYLSLVWWRVARNREKQNIHQFNVSPYITSLGYVFWGFKALFMCLGYAFVFRFLWSQI